MPLQLAAIATMLLLAREPAAPPPEPQDVGMLRGFLRQPGMGGWLATIAAFKFGEASATAMLRPLFVDRDLSLVALGWITGTAGFIAGLVGAMIGGALVGAYGRYRMLLISGLLQAVAVASYALLALGPLDLTRVYVICILEHLASGMATAAHRHGNTATTACPRRTRARWTSTCPVAARHSADATAK